ncbi:MAG: CPBP family intramembrane metalloprotease [Clostridia bacterium]|nr:CPBP family intramembrane metalloprotease [Clostridia bacterium]
MKNTRKEKLSFLGEPTSAKASGLTFTLAAAGLVLLSFVFLLALAIGGLWVEGVEQKEWYLYCSFLLSPLAFSLVAVWVLRWTKTPILQEVKLQKCAPKYFLIAFLLQVGLLSLSQLNDLFLQFLARFGYENTPIVLPSMDGFGVVGVLFAVALLPALFEELIFRGLLLKGMRSFGTAGAVLISGALFALYHQNPAQTLYQFCCGAAFALVAVRSGSILPTVFSHFLNNAVIILFTKFGVGEFSPIVSAIVLSVSIACLVGTLVWLVWFEKKGFKKEDNKTARKQFWLAAAVGIGICALTWLSVLFSGM